MTTPDNPTLIGMYETMSKITAADAKIRTLIVSGAVMIQYYSPRGQEVIPAAISAALARDDYVVTTYRGLHDQIAKGVPLPELLAEYLGRRTGTCKGKGGGMHITHPDSGLMVTTGIVGGGIPIANGLALASVLRGDHRVTVANFGDGAANIGGFHEALNMASLWKLPVIFCCQNNGYGEHTKYAKATAVDAIAERAAAYKMVGITVDGSDPVAVYVAAKEAIDRARSGEGPTLLEALTYRFFGHFFGDDTHYMPKEEVAAAVAADPVPALRGRLIQEGRATEVELEAIDERVKQEVEEAAAFALNSEFAGPEEIETDVYGVRVPA